MCVCVCGPISSVGIVTGYELDRPGSNLFGDEVFQTSRSALGLTQPPVQRISGLSRAKVRPGRVVEHSTLLVQRSWNSTATRLPNSGTHRTVKRSFYITFNFYIYQAVNEYPRSDISLFVDWYNVRCFQHHTAGYCNVMLNTKAIIVAVGCWENFWEATYSLYCVSNSRYFIVNYINFRIFGVSVNDSVL